MEQGKAEEGKTAKDLAKKVQKLEQELKQKELEAYKLKRLFSLGLKPSYSEFLQGDCQEEFEKSLSAFLDEQKKALATSGLKEAPRGPGVVKSSPEEKVKEEIIAIGKRRLQ